MLKVQISESFAENKYFISCDHINLEDNVR